MLKFLFNPDFTIKIETSQEHVVKRLAELTELRDIRGRHKTDKIIRYYGTLNYSDFELSTKDNSLENQIVLKGRITEQNDGTIISGTIKRYLFTLAFIVLMTIGCCFATIVFFLQDLSWDFDSTFLGILTGIGTMNYFGFTGHLNKLKSDFERNIKTKR